MDEGTLLLSDRPLSAYVNALAKAGLAIEQMIAQADGDLLPPEAGSGFAKRARPFPVTCVIRARKL